MLGGLTQIVRLVGISHTPHRRDSVQDDWDSARPPRWDQSGGPVPPRKRPRIVATEWHHATRPDGVKVVFRYGELLPDWVPGSSE